MTNKNNWIYFLLLMSVFVSIYLCYINQYENQDIENFTPTINKMYRPIIRHWRIGAFDVFSRYHKYIFVKLKRYLYS